MAHTVKVLMTEFVTHDVKRFIVSKPDGFKFDPGNGVEIFINQPHWRDEEGRPFTPTSLNDDNVLEFMIKRYPEHPCVTDKLHTLKAGEQLLISEPFGSIRYKGPGTFLAAGAGLTPFLSIFREMANCRTSFSNHYLFYTNKSAADIMCERELQYYLGDKALFSLSREKKSVYHQGRITKALIKKKVSNLNQYFYICGTDAFVEKMNEILKDLGVSEDLLVFEE